MSLPYPHEVETGELKRRPTEPRTPLDVEAHVADAIRVRGDGLEVFGVPLAVPAPDSAESVAEQLRRSITTHFQEHMSAPDIQTWESFASQAQAQLAGRTELDPATIALLRVTIDAL